MGEINFDIDFVKRTKQILAEYEGEYKLTILLNCMLGLVVLPNERSQGNFPERWDKNIEDISIYSDLNIITFYPIKGRERATRDLIYYPKTLQIFLKKMRNGIAHQNIEAINENGSFVGVKIRNLFSNIVDFEVEFRRKGLEKFSLFIADQYLDGFN